MPIINRDDAAEVDEHLTRAFALPPSSRADALRALFVEKLDFAPASGYVSLAKASRAVDLPTQAERLATMDGVTAVFVPLDVADTDRVRKSEAATAARLISNELAGDLFLVMTNTSGSQLHFIYPTFESATPHLRRMVVERDLMRRTAVQQLSEIYWNWKDTGSIHHALEEAFDVEAVTRRFFEEYKAVFDYAMENVTGFGTSEEEAEAKRLFVQTMFNRLMFVYFVSRKGWLKFKGSRDYLNALWKDYSAQSEDRNFYTNRLKPVFFAGMNNPQSMDLMRNNLSLYSLIGDVPFLNGGLFDEMEQDSRTGVVVPDDVVERVLRDLFDRFNFTVMESTPFDVEVAVDPEMLGKVFEELVTGRHESGSYYTPRAIVAFMCREALKGYLESQATGASSEAIRDFVDDRDTTGLSVTTAPEISKALSRMTVLDPACGSGAYLVGMLQELIDLETALYSENLVRDPQSLYQLKLRIIEQNLYGADIDWFAVNIAMLRLWLSLAIEYDGPKPEPLPNLDFKIVCGDSLTSPDPAPQHQLRMFADKAHGLRETLERAKAKYMTAIGPDKSSLKQEIETMESELASALDDRASGDRSVEWRVQFAEVFDRREGFDVVIANPPYRRQEGLGSKKTDLQRLYPDVYTSTADYHVYFFNRAIQLLREGGELAFITSNKYMRARYGEKIRRFVPESLTLRQVVDFGDLPVFTAASYPAILVGAKSAPDPEHRLRIADLAMPVRRVLTEQGLAVNRETVTRAMDALPRLLIDHGVPDYPQVLLRKSGWILEDPKLIRLFDRLMSQGTPMGEFVQGRMYRGITTGLNEAFVIDEAKRQELIEADPRSAEVIKPWLQGKDIDRWRVRPSGRYLIAIQNSDDADARNPWSRAVSVRAARRIFSQTYPAILEHLSKFEEFERVTRSGRVEVAGLHIRQDHGKWWWELRACSYYREFAEPKVIWKKTAFKPAFLSEQSGSYLANTLHFVAGGDPWLAALMNSSFMEFIMVLSINLLRGGYIELTPTRIESLPVPQLSDSDRRDLDALTLRGAGSDLDIDSEIDDLLAKRFRLNTSELSAIGDYLSVRRALGPDDAIEEGPTAE